jgi:hypothetical protein
MLYPRWPRFSSVGIDSDTNPARRDVHQLRHIVLHASRAVQAPGYNYSDPQTVQAHRYDYGDTLIARLYLHELPHGSWIQQLRRPHIHHHTHHHRTDNCAHSPRRPNNADRIPNHHPSRLDFHRTRRQAHAHGVRHITRLYHHQHNQPPRRKQHNHDHRDNDLLRNRLDLQRHALRSSLSTS